MDQIITIISTAIGVVASWWFSRYFYLKNKPEQLSVQAIIEAFRKEQRSGDTKTKETEVLRKWALALIEAFENNEVFLTELEVAAKGMKDVGELLLGVMRSASQAAAKAGMTLTPPWHEAYDKVLREGLSKMKSDLQSRLLAKH